MTACCSADVSCAVGSDVVSDTPVSPVGADVVSDTPLTPVDVHDTLSSWVPLSAVVEAKDGKYGVFVVSNSTGEEMAHLHSVEIGSVNGTEISVVSGLQAGDRVITTGANLLKDGQRVEVLQ